LRRAEGVPYAKGELGRRDLHRFILERHAGKLEYRESMLASMERDLGRRQRPLRKFKSYGHALVPDPERLIENHKERYYETLEQSSAGGHEGKHDPWPYLNFLFFIVKSAYREFEDRLGKTKSPRGAKTQMIESAIGRFRGSFTLTQLEDACPGVSRDMIRKTLRDLQRQGGVECLGRGPGAAWRKKR
jgi:hypothetical protein